MSHLYLLDRTLTHHSQNSLLLTSSLFKCPIYHTSVAEMETNDLLRSTVMDETHPNNTNNDISTISDPSPTGRTWRLRTVRNRFSCGNHIQNTLSTKNQDREVVKRSLESGQSDDPVHQYKFGKMARMFKDEPFKIVRTREEVDMTWTRPVVSAALVMNFFDNKDLVHNTVLMTTECAECYNWYLTSWSCVTMTLCGGRTSPRCFSGTQIASLEIRNGWLSPLTFVHQNHLSDDF